MAVSQAAMAVTLYALCSGSLLVLNKLTLHFIPLPSGVTIIQLSSALFLVTMFALLGLVSLDRFSFKRARPYMYYSVVFVMGVYSNMKALHSSNVETVIVFRAMTPLFVSILDALLLGRECPSPRSFMGLFIIVVGAAGYVATDREFSDRGPNAYVWPIIYLAMICVEMTYGKKIVSEHKASLSTSVLYTNVFSILPMSLLFLGTQELESVSTSSADVDSYYIDSTGVALLIASCIVGTGIGYSGWWCRSQVSATTFTMVGVVNKVLTIMVNQFVWSQHASSQGIVCLMLCLMGGGLYRQPPLRASRRYQPLEQTQPGDIEMATRK